MSKHLKNGLTVLFAISAMGLASCGREPVGPAVPEGAVPDRLAPFPSQPCQLGLSPPIPDPITITDFPHSVQISYTTDNSGDPNTEGVIFLPASFPGPIPDAGMFPVVLVLHAFGYDYQWYTDLQHHLARNGFAVASINWQNNSASTDMQDHLDYLFNEFAFRTRLVNNVALVGHSRGGKWVVEFAADVNAHGYNVRAVAALAPAPGPNPSSVIVNYPSRSLLVMLCAEDQDAFADGATRIPGAVYNNVKISGFLTYDAAGPFANEFNSLPGLPFAKSMIYLKGGDHWAFASTGIEFHMGNFEQIDVDPIWIDMTKGYVNAYLRWALRGQSIYQAYFKEKRRPPALAPQIELSTQYSSSHRQVVDNFENNNKLLNTAGGQNILENLSVGHDESVDLNDTSPHATRVYEVSWLFRTPDRIPRIIFNIPPGGAAMGNPRNVSGSEFLSFRVGQIIEDPLNPEDEPQDFFVFLESGNGIQSPAVKVSQFGGIPYPYPGPDWVNEGELPKHSAMSTILIPLCKFENVSTLDVAKVVFQFTVAGHQTGKVQIDNVEFVK